MNSKHDIFHLISFSTINISMSLNSSNFTFVFFKVACHAYLDEENEQDQAYIFSDTYLENFQIQQLAIMHCFEH